MGRVVKIIIYALVILALWFWFSSIFKSCNTPTVDSTDTVSITDEAGDDTEYVEDDFFADEVEGESETVNDDDFIDESTAVDPTEEDEIDYSTIDDELEDKPVTKPAPRENTNNRPATTQTTSTASSNTNSNGRYLVIAGSYLVESNANTMRSKLSNLGYKSEVIVFDLSEFHSVCAGRYSDYDDALNASSRLKQQGIDNYVHTRKR